MRSSFKIYFYNGWLWGAVWFFIVLYGSGSIANLIGDELPDEFMGKAVEIGVALFIVGIAVAFIVNRCIKKFFLGFLFTFLAMTLFMAVSIIIHTRR